MKRLFLSLTFTTISLICFADDTPRKPMEKGSFSVGVTPVFRLNSNTSTNGANSINTRFTRIGLGVPVRYFVSKNFGIEANFGIVSNGTKTDFGTGKSTITTSGLDLGIGIIKPVILYTFTNKGSVVLTPKVQSSIFSGSSKTTTANTNFKDDATGIQIGAFLGAEWFPQAIGLSQLSLQASISVFGFTSSSIGNKTDENVWFFNPINTQAGSVNFLSANFGFHYYFF